MNAGEIYAKTDEGLRELKERKLNLPIALRSVLIMVDGNRTVGEVLERAQALRVDASTLAALERAGLIAKRFSAPSGAEAAQAPAPRTADEVHELFHRLSRELGITLIVATHNERLSRSMTRVLRLQDGRLHDCA